MANEIKTKLQSSKQIVRKDEIGGIVEQYFVENPIEGGLTPEQQVKLNSIDNKANSTDVYTKAEIEAKGYLTEHQDITGKVDKEVGKGLSTNDYTTTEKTKLAGLENYDDTEIRAYINNKVDKTELPTEIENYFTENPIEGELINQNGGGSLKIWAGTKAQYDALLIKDEDTVYLVEGSSGSDVVTTTYSITNNLTNCTSNNSSVSVSENSSYSATITANSGYNLSSVSVTMGGNDITSDVYSNGNISISSVTGNIVITATATSSSPIVPPTGNTLTYKVGKTCDASGVISDDDKKILIEDIPVSTESSDKVTVKFKDNSDIWFTARCFNESGTCLGSVNPANLTAPVTGQPQLTRTLETGTKYIKLIIAMDDYASTIATEDYIKDKIIVVNDVEYSLVKGQ